MGHLDSEYLTFSHRRKVAEVTRVLSPASGFRSMRGRVFYVTRQKKLRVVISTIKTADNKGPAVSSTSLVDWPEGGKNLSGMRAHLDAKMVALERGIRARTWPERENQLPRCNRPLRPVAEFTEQRCLSCSCPYCLVER